MSAHNKTIAANVAASIREDILSGAFAPGEALRQDMLAERFSVSRIPVREALLQLEAQGLITVNAHRGGVVVPMSNEEANEIFYLRAKLEPDLVAYTVREASAETLAEAKRLYQEMNDELSARGPTPSFGDMHWQFHRTLYAGNTREQSIAIVDRLYLLSERYIRLHLRKKMRAPRSKKEHKALLDACLTGKSHEAAKLVKAHIEATAADLRVALEA